VPPERTVRTPPLLTVRPVLVTPEETVMLDDMQRLLGTDFFGLRRAGFSADRLLVFQERLIKRNFVKS
jgi:hypothetical protein